MRKEIRLYWIILGLILIQLLSIFMTQGTQIPPYQVITPWNLVLETFVIILMLFVLDAIVTAYFIVKKEISEAGK